MAKVEAPKMERLRMKERKASNDLIIMSFWLPVSVGVSWAFVGGLGGIFEVIFGGWALEDICETWGLWVVEREVAAKEGRRETTLPACCLKPH